jgi:signal peptidase I
MSDPQVSMEQIVHPNPLSSRESQQQSELSRVDVERQSSSGFHRELRVWARDLVVALGLAMIIIVFFYQPVKVEGTSMAPLLSDQERIFINKFVYHFEPIGRGDVVVFWYPLDRTKSFIKRVVGLPGDEVEIRRGRVYINGKTLEEPYVPSQYIDTAAYGPVQIPRDEYFVMGDHRISSNDSRIFGPVPSAFIYGKAVFAYWPWTQFGSISAVNASESSH